MADEDEIRRSWLLIGQSASVPQYSSQGTRQTIQPLSRSKERGQTMRKTRKQGRKKKNEHKNK